MELVKQKGFGRWLLGVTCFVYFTVYCVLVNDFIQVQVHILHKNICMLSTLGLLYKRGMLTHQSNPLVYSIYIIRPNSANNL